MKLISKARPFSLFWILVIEAVVWILLIVGSVFIDLAIYDPPPGTVGFPFPIVTMLSMALAAFSMAITAIGVIIAIMVLLRRK